MCIIYIRTDWSSVGATMTFCKNSVSGKIKGYKYIKYNCAITKLVYISVLEVCACEASTLIANVPTNFISGMFISQNILILMSVMA